jgi:dTDP-4-dehydrorhamnose 3,5-epimerase
MTERFQIEPTELSDLVVITRAPRGDSRGFLERMFCVEELADLLADRSIRQINHTLTRTAGTVRGMHYQRPPHGETKIVSCLRGEVYDVAVDLRAGSPTFLRWFGTVLSAENFRTLYIPEGFAHGFQTLTEDCELIYLHTHDYVPEAEAAVNALDPKIGIEWPHPIAERSDRDQNAGFVGDTFAGVRS